jgi:hypothetical protein
VDRKHHSRRKIGTCKRTQAKNHLEIEKEFKEEFMRRAIELSRQASIIEKVVGFRQLLSKMVKSLLKATIK